MDVQIREYVKLCETPTFHKLPYSLSNSHQIFTILLYLSLSLLKST